MTQENKLAAELRDFRAEYLSSLEATLSSQTAESGMVAETKRLTKVLEKPFCVLFLDGRNEHGTHVLTSYPRSFEVSEDDISVQSEAIMTAAEDEGFSAGDHVWAEFVRVQPQIGDEGRIELDGYWDFKNINVPASWALMSISLDALSQERK